MQDPKLVPAVSRKLRSANCCYMCVVIIKTHSSIFIAVFSLRTVTKTLRKISLNFHMPHINCLHC
jgi:hypothetical protein